MASTDLVQVLVTVLCIFFINAGYLAENINRWEVQCSSGYLKSKAKLDKSS